MLQKVCPFFFERKLRGSGLTVFSGESNKVEPKRGDDRTTAEKPKQLYLSESAVQLNSCNFTDFEKGGPNSEPSGNDYVHKDLSVQIPHLIRSNQVLSSTIAHII